MTYWEKKDGIYKETLESQKGDILYAADTYTEDGTLQTEISDWHEPRYEVRENRFFSPDDTDDNVLGNISVPKPPDGHTHSRVRSIQPTHPIRT